MQGITDRDIAYDMLFGCKQSAKTYLDAALEAATPSCRRTFMELVNRTQESQNRIWQYLHQRQEYRVTEAHPEEVRSSRERMERLREDHLQGAYSQGQSFGNQSFGGQSFGNRGSWETREPAGAVSRGGFRDAGWNPVSQTSGGFNSGGYGAPSGGRWESSPRH